MSGTRGLTPCPPSACTGASPPPATQSQWSNWQEEIKMTKRWKLIWSWSWQSRSPSALLKHTMHRGGIFETFKIVNWQKLSTFTQGFSFTSRVSFPHFVSFVYFLLLLSRSSTYATFNLISIYYLSFLTNERSLQPLTLALCISKVSIWLLQQPNKNIYWDS